MMLKEGLRTLLRTGMISYSLTKNLDEFSQSLEVAEFDQLFCEANLQPG